MFPILEERYNTVREWGKEEEKEAVKDAESCKVMLWCLSVNHTSPSSEDPINSGDLLKAKCFLGPHVAQSQVDVADKVNAVHYFAHGQNAANINSWFQTLLECLY